MSDQAMDPANTDGEGEGPRVFGRRRGTSAPPRVEERDFRRTPPPSNAMRRELEALAARLAMRLQRGLSNHRRQVIPCTPVAPDLLEFAEAATAFGERDWFVPLLAEGGDRAVLRFDEASQNALLTRILGGGPAPVAAEAEPEDDFFEFETALSVEIGPISRAALRPLVRALLREVNGTLREGRAAYVIDAQRETLPGVRQLRAADAVASFDFEFQFGPERARVALLVQAESLTKLLAAPVVKPVQPQGPGQRGRLEGLVRGLDVDLRVILGHASIRIADYLELQAGDVLVLDRKVGEPLEVRAGAEHSFTAQPGRSGDRLAVRILERRQQESGR
jgi:flagellar motor switch protein FliM